MTDPYLFERGIGQQMGDLCRLAVGTTKVTQTGEIVTLEDMLGRGAFGVSVEVPYTSGVVQSLSVTRCGKVIFQNPVDYESTSYTISDYSNYRSIFDALSRLRPRTYKTYDNCKVKANGATNIRILLASGLSQYFPGPPYNYDGLYIGSQTITNNFKTSGVDHYVAVYFGSDSGGIAGYHKNLRYCLPDVELTDDDTYTGDTYTITLPADFYGGTVNLTAGTVTSIYAADGSVLAEPVVTDIDPISIPILAGVNNIWANVGTVTVSYYAGDAETFRPGLWYPTIYRGLTSARYLIKRASGEIASFDDAVAAPLVGLRVALPYDAEGYQSVGVTVNGTLKTITFPTTICGGYLDAVTGQLVATHDADGNALTNQKLYFLPPTNINALAGVNNIWADVGTVMVSYRVEQ